MRSGLASRHLALMALAALLALGLTACGGDDGDGALDVAALESCLDEDPATDLERESGDFEDAEEPPTDQFELTPTDSETFPVPTYVLVFADEVAADAAVSELRGNDLIELGESGTVRWVVVSTDDGYSDELDSTISDCVDQSS